MSVHELSPRASTASSPAIGAEPGDGVPFDFVEAKVRVPVPRPGSITRTALVNRLRATTSVPVASFVAPAGFGKTTLLGQWAERDKRPFAWVSIDERDDDPLVLLRHVAAAVDAVSPIDSSLVDALRSPGRSIWTAVVPRLGSALAAVEHPFVVVLDDAHRLRAGDPADAVATLADHIPEGSMLVLAGRTTPRLPIAALRAGGRLLEIGHERLALSRREAHLLLRSTGVPLAEADVDEILRTTEGWAAGLYLAALSFRERGSSYEGTTFAGDDRYLADYFRSEYLSRLTPEHLAFLRRTSVLDRMCGALCDAVLDRTDSALELEWIDEANLFLVPLDHRRRWYRYHHLFKDLLRRELEEYEPESVAVLNRRAADWFESHGDLEAALEAAAASGDMDRVAGLVGSLGLPLASSGRFETVESWLARLDDEAQLERHPAVAVVGAWIHALRGRADAAEKWLGAAERCAGGGKKPNRTPSLRAEIAVVRAALCRDGVERMLSDATDAVGELPPDSRWLPTAFLLQGAAHVLRGDDERGEHILMDAVRAAERADAADVRVAAIGIGALLAARRDDQAAEPLVQNAAGGELGGEAEGGVSSAAALAASARLHLRRGRWNEAKAELRSAGRLLPLLTHALPWLAVLVRLELARAYITLRDADAAAARLAETREILRLRPGLDVLRDQTDELEREVDGVPGIGTDTGSGLTNAELRLLPLLATHLSFREIGGRLYVSRNTVKTQAISVYRKLGVSSRSEAIDRAARLGLVEAGAGLPHGDFIPNG
jgi:LuxR family maltose regulon positive regulatory protein